jgi:hypothetical protein
MKLGLQQLNDLGFEAHNPKVPHVFIAHVADFEFTYDSEKNTMRMGLEDGNGCHVVKNLAEFKTLHDILTGL